MQARGPLMIEHRLIERMINLMKDEVLESEKTSTIDPSFVDKAVDFIRTYADRTHHGKEEDILFRDLNGKELSKEDKKAMNELVEDHAFGRKTTKALVEANTRYRDGDTSALKDVLNSLQALVDLYPGHIEKEDKVFFPACLNYFSEAEDQGMLAEFLEFDRKMIHEKYELVIKDLEDK